MEQDEAENEDKDDVGQACQLKWHKVTFYLNVSFISIDSKSDMDGIITGLHIV